MNDTFEPGPGWREIALEERPTYGVLVEWIEKVATRAWVRKAPMPPLPTEDWTVIQGVWRDSILHEQFYLAGGQWWSMPNQGKGYDPRHLADALQSFEVLPEPGAITAKAVLDRVWRYVGDYEWLDNLRREYGAES